MSYMNKILKAGIAMEHLIWFIISFILLIHLFCCLWVFLGKYEEYNYRNWIYSGNYMDFDNFELYSVSLYWAVTTLTTVGYGDITAHSLTEMVVCCIVMIIGVFLYSYTIGSITNLLTNIDSRKAKLN